MFTISQDLKPDRSTGIWKAMQESQTKRYGITLNYCTGMQNPRLGGAFAPPRSKFYPLL